MFETLIRSIILVGVRIFNAVPEKYLFRSLLPKKSNPHSWVALLSFGGGTSSLEHSCCAARRSNGFAYSAQSALSSLISDKREYLRPLGEYPSSALMICNSCGIDDIHAFGVVWRELLAIFTILCYTNHRKAVRI